MNTLNITVQDRVAVIALNRGRSNAINAAMLNELQQIIRSIETDPAVAGVILTGNNNGFFSAGLDLIELYGYDEAQIREFWINFLSFIAALASFKKPLVSAITGHSPAGGCVLAICSDYRLMSEGNYIIGLNEVPVGIIVPDSIFCLYSFWLGQAKASRFILEGKLMDPAKALAVGLIDELVRPESIITAAKRQMQKYIQLDATTWQQTKLNIRKELIARVQADQSEMLQIMLTQWWSPSTRSILQTIIQNLQKKPANG